MHFLTLASGLLLALVAPAVLAAEPLQIPRVDTDIVVDGQLDDAAWAHAATVDLAFEASPGDNLPASVKTTARIAYTEDALLVSFRAEDPDPSKLRAFLRDRDALTTDDFVGVQLDTFDDQRRAYQFMVNPFGVQGDAIKVEATGEEDFSWDGLWSSAARLGPHGFDVEMRIPLATLRFADTDGPRRWGARFLRVRPREHRYLYADTRMERGARCDLCTIGKIEGFEGVRQGRNLEITPTLTVIKAEQRAGHGTAWHSDGTEIEPGLDVAWAPSPNLTLNATLNPDFSQVESDEAQLDLNTSFALFFPEKRPFFLEGADYFNTPLDVLYTRQIADPDAGLRVTGRNGAHAYGAIVARDATTQILVPGVLRSGFRFLDEPSDVLVGRYRHDLNEYTSLGAITTLRRGEDYRNALAGIDGRWQRGAHTVIGQWLRSESEYPLDLDLDDTSPRGDALQLAYSYGVRNWSANVSHTDIDPGFRADLGFISQVGYGKSVVGGSRTWFGQEGATINRIAIDGDWDITRRFDGQLLEREVEGYFDVQAARQSHFRLGALDRVRFWNDRLFDETLTILHSHLRPWSSLEVGFDARVGDALDLLASQVGDLTEWKPWLSLDLGRGVSVKLTYVTQRLRRNGGTAYDADVLDGRLSWQFDPRQRLRLALQANQIERDPSRYATPVSSSKRDVAAQLIYSYKANPRTALYAGYSHGAFDVDDADDADDIVDDPLLDSNRSLFLKLSYAWQP